VLGSVGGPLGSGQPTCGIGNLAVRGVDHLQAIVKQRLKRIQYRTDLIDSFLVHTGLNLEPRQP
jgi:hypothetical protein